MYLQIGAKLRTQTVGTAKKKGGRWLPMVRSVAPIRFRVGGGVRYCVLREKQKVGMSGVEFRFIGSQ